MPPASHPHLTVPCHPRPVCRRPYEIFLEMKTLAVDTDAPFFMGYIVEKGKEPVNAAGKIAATEIMCSGTGMVTGAMLQMEKVKDETQGDKDYKVRTALLARARARC